MSINSNSTNIQLDTKRHSFAHLMAAAVEIYFKQESFRDKTTYAPIQFGVGPVIENGCYYDFILPRNLVPDDLKGISKVINNLIKQDLVFERKELEMDKAIELFKSQGQLLKVELLENLRDKGTTSLSEEEKADFEAVSTKSLYLKEINMDFEDISNDWIYEYLSCYSEFENYGSQNKIDLNYEFVKLELFLSANKISSNNIELNKNDFEKIVNKNNFIKYFDTAFVASRPSEVQIEKIIELIVDNKITLTLTDGNDNYILKIIEQLKSNLATITTYSIINNKTNEVIFEDLCKGPHIGEGPVSPLEEWQPEVDGVDNLIGDKRPEWQKKSLFPFWLLPKNKELVTTATELRGQGILPEVRFWQKLKSSDALQGFDIDRQVIIGSCIVDFFIAELGLVIEIDGTSHNGQEEKDQNREVFLKGLGLKIVRFMNGDVMDDITGVATKLKMAISERSLELRLKSTPSSSDDTPQRGESFSDLSFQLDKFSASYWRGDQERAINMQRLYAVVMDTAQELTDFLTQREEAKKYDHRILGQQLDLFSFSDLVGPGLPLFSPKGTMIRNLLKNNLFQISKKYGCQEVTIPHMAKIELYETSGHAKKFSGELFHVKSHYDTEFVLKPVNCPHHTQIFASRPRSYKDLPLRYIESTMQYRDEKPGAIGGLTRVRAITCDDGHSFCTPDQIKEEILSLCNIIKEFYTGLNMYGNHWVSISVRDYSKLDGYTGFPEDWDKAESMLKEINEELGLGGKVCEGEAAIYGPKLDFMYKDLQGNERQLSTVQLDFATPKRFGLEYKEADGTLRPPVMIHRAILGSYERFLAILLETTKGHFPFWLAPEQIRILTINDQVLPFVDKIKLELDQVVLMKPLKYNELRYTVDSRSESLGKKIREAKLDKIPMLMIIGDKDVEASEVSVEYNGVSSKVKLEELKSWIEAAK